MWPHLFFQNLFHKFWKHFSISWSWSQMANKASVSLVRLVQSLNHNRFIIIIHNFSIGFKLVSFLGIPEPLFGFLYTLTSLFSRLTWGQVLLTNTPTIWKYCLHVKYPQEKIILMSFTFSCVRSLCLVSGMMNADKYIDVIQRKVVRDM